MQWSESLFFIGVPSDVSRATPDRVRTRLATLLVVFFIDILSQYVPIFFKNCVIVAGFGVVSLVTPFYPGGTYCIVDTDHRAANNSRGGTESDTQCEGCKNGTSCELKSWLFFSLISWYCSILTIMESFP